MAEIQQPIPPLMISRHYSQLLKVDDYYFYDYLYYPEKQTVLNQYDYIKEFEHYYNITQDSMYDCFKEYFGPSVEQYKEQFKFQNELNNIETNFLQKNIQIAYHYIVAQKEITPILAKSENICLIINTYKNMQNPNYIDIYNVCAGSACKKKKLVLEGKEHSIVKVILNKIIELYQNEKLSLFVDLIKNPKPIETCGLYISLGFGNPRLSKRLNIDINNPSYPQLRLDLTPATRQNNIRQKEEILANIVKIKHKFTNEIKNNIIKIQISRNIFMYLQNIVEQKSYEVCGIFKLSDLKSTDEFGIKSYNLQYMCNYEIYGTGNTDSKQQPISDSLKYICIAHRTPITYHTHPSSYNIDRNFEYGFFSAGDLSLYLENTSMVWYRGNEMMADPYNMLFLVYAKEGLYSLQCNDNIFSFFNQLSLDRSDNLELICIYLFFGLAIADMVLFFQFLSEKDIGPYNFVNQINKIPFFDYIVEGHKFINDVTNIKNYENPNSYIYRRLLQFKRNGQYSSSIKNVLRRIIQNETIRYQFNTLFDFLDIMINAPEKYAEHFMSGVGMFVLLNTKTIRCDNKLVIKSKCKLNKEKVKNSLNNIEDPIFIVNYIPDFTEDKTIPYSEIYYYNYPQATPLQDNILNENMLAPINPPFYPKYGFPSGVPNSLGERANPLAILEKKRVGFIQDNDCTQTIKPIDVDETLFTNIDRYIE